MRAWALIAAACVALGCRPRSSSSSGEAGPAAPAVDHGDPLPYHGTWVGPELTLTFAGPWVLVRPTVADPAVAGSAAPRQAVIELRATVERREGDAFALRTSVAGLLAADFVRPTDWTLLAEGGQLAIAMGDEPLTAYIAHEVSPPLLGPAMIDELELPEQIVMADAVACLELASSSCVELEAGGPLASGCRELHWAACVAHLGPHAADPTVRAAQANAEQIHTHALAVRFADGLRRGAPAAQRDDAEALYARALERAAKVLDELRRDGPLPDDPNLPDLLAAIEAGPKP